MKTPTLAVASSWILLAGCGASSVPVLTQADSGYFRDPDADPATLMSVQEIQDEFGDDVCEALGEQPVMDGTPSGYRQGLRAKVHVPPADFRTQLGPWRSLLRYFQPDVEPLTSEIFLEKVSVPTRAFTTGFPTLSGALVKDSEGEDLIEYFGLDIESEIVMESGASPTVKEWALLADDGVRLSLAGSPVAFSAGVHPTRLVCGTQAIPLIAGQNIPLRLQYFQGPRHHIALTLLWRDAAISAEPLCGAQGNTFWFDDQSQPTLQYQSLLQRGWEPVPAAHFQVPDSSSFNPCRSRRVREVLGAL